MAVAGGGEWAFIFSYVAFILFLGIILTLQGSEKILAPDSSLNITKPTPPSPAGLDILTFIVYVIANIGFLLTIAFLNPFSGFGLLGWISIVGGIVMLYIFFRLIRGGG